MILKLTRFSPKLVSPSTYHPASSANTIKILSQCLFSTPVDHTLYPKIYCVWIPLVSFVSYRTLIPILPCYSAHSAAPKPPARPDLMLSDTILVVCLLSAPFDPLMNQLCDLVHNRSHAFFLHAQATPLHSSQTTPQILILQVSPFYSLVVGSLLSVHHTLRFLTL